MADGRDDYPGPGDRRAYLWADIFRCFQVALDPRKLVVAAAGILVMSLGWSILSMIFYSDRPVYQDEAYQNQAKNQLGEKKADGSFHQPEDYLALAQQLYDRDVERWKVLADLAGPNGRLRVLPWNEYRGPNPFVLVADLFSGNPAERAARFNQFLSGTVPVLFEPLVKLFLPLVRFLDANASPWTRVYLLLCLAWSLATWAFFGGVITRIAAVQLTGKDRVTLGEAIRYVSTRYLSYVLSPLVPLGVIAVVAVGLAVYGMLAMIPLVGDLVLYGLGFPLLLLGGLVMAILFVGLVGYPLMYATISTEGSDTFDALSRAYNYVFQSPWHYLWYCTVAVLYGAAVTLFVVFLGSLTVYMAKWAVAQAPLSEYAGRKPDFLFLHAPESFGWQELFLAGTPAEVQARSSVNSDTGRFTVAYVVRDQNAFDRYVGSLWGIEKFASWMVALWLVLAFMLMLGFSYSYFWTAATMIYLLMRKKVDETELDEIYVEEDLPEPPSPPATKAPESPAPTGATSLPTVPPPPPAPDNSSPPLPPPPPATIPFAGGPTTASSPVVVLPDESVEKKPDEKPEKPADEPK